METISQESTKILILGAGESGIGAALLCAKHRLSAFVSDYGQIYPDEKKILEEINVPFEENGHHFESLVGGNLVVKSPGIPDSAKVIVDLKAKGCEVISEIEFAWRFCKGKVLAITGSNGKTTTTGLLGHILKYARLDVAVGGNIGIGFSKLLSESDHDWFVLEVSSFQLDDIVGFKPKVAILTNITPDHLDRYQYNFENYIQSKLRIGMNQDHDDWFVYSAQDSLIKDHIPDGYLGKQLGLIPNIENGKIASANGTMFNLNNKNLQGRHNAINAQCAVEAALRIGIDPLLIQEALDSFVNAPHRLECIREVDDVTYINDSKATNVDAVWYALDAVNAPIIWIVGGTDKGNDYFPLGDLVREKVRVILCLGVDNSKILEHFKGFGKQLINTQSMDGCFEALSKVIQKGDTVLLSPACASFDLFKNYMDRGDQFRERVNGL